MLSYGGSQSLVMALWSHRKRNRIIHELKLTLISLLVFGVLLLLAIYSHPFIIYGILLSIPTVIIIISFNRLVELVFFSGENHSLKELAMKLKYSNHSFYSTKSSPKRPRYWKDIKSYQPIREDDKSTLPPPENP